MSVLRSRKVFAIACAAIAPISFFGGAWLKDRIVERNFADAGTDERDAKSRLRIAALQQERSDLLRERDAVDLKITELRHRMESSSNALR